jgi:hypothetical protein
MSVSTKFDDTPQYSGIRLVNTVLYFSESGVSEFKCPFDTDVS